MTEHLFLASPTNSGSRWLYRVVGDCQRAVCLRDKEGTHREGQYIWPSGAGPSCTGVKAHRLWTEHEDIFNGKEHYDWMAIKNRWAHTWETLRGDITDPVFVEKTPVNLMRIEMLAEWFPGCKFLIWLRNPYATCESIRRQVKEVWNVELDIGRIANHWMKCAGLVAYHAENTPNALTFCYESIPEFAGDISDFCGTPDLDLSGFENMNHKADDLTKRDVMEITNVLTRQPTVLDYFEYGVK